MLLELVRSPSVLSKLSKLKRVVKRSKRKKLDFF
jgi:hypothetical protein